MNQGKKEKAFIVVAKVLNLFFLTHKKTDLYTHGLDFKNWAFLYFAYTTIVTKVKKTINFSFQRFGNSLNHHFFKKGTKYHSMLNNPHLFAAKYLLMLQPLFNFSLFSLDKKARKRSRKKGSKYIFIWKYVPIYKRKSLLLKLIVSDIKFNEGRALHDRLLNSLETLYKTPHKSYAYRINNFTNNYVFRNLRRSLLTNFKTTA